MEHKRNITQVSTTRGHRRPLLVSRMGRVIPFSLSLSSSRIFRIWTGMKTPHPVGDTQNDYCKKPLTGMFQVWSTSGPGSGHVTSSRTSLTPNRDHLILKLLMLQVSFRYSLVSQNFPSSAVAVTPHSVHLIQAHDVSVNFDLSLGRSLERTSKFDHPIYYPGGVVPTKSWPTLIHVLYPITQEPCIIYEGVTVTVHTTKCL